MRATRFACIAATAVLLAACSSGGGGTAGHDMSEMEGHGQGGHGGNFNFGRPAQPAEADRTVRIRALDSLEFKPSRLRVEEGETVEFIVTNPGRIVHEFVLGDADFQEMHAGEMHQEAMQGPYGVTVQPGSTERLAWRFTRPGEVLFACHIPGHYEGGMVGTIEVG